jgi:leucine-zipper of insertion element IS481
MKDTSSQSRIVTPAQRALIIQRVIVDSWSTEAAATAFGLPERLVELWVTDFRRHGMASLRHDPRKIVRLAVPPLLRAVFRRVASSLRRVSAVDPLPQPSPLRRLPKDGRR